MRANENIKVGDTLFKVDPQKLVITRTNVVEVSGEYGSVSKEHKPFQEKVKAPEKIAINNFPAENNGMLYFRTEEDAQKFIKTQIGI
ncbi:MAG: hypothetical protein E6772_03460 [Dysgonomonas sp.]|nr:hypothetical protein [Dysgonomonas sp.]